MKVYIAARGEDQLLAKLCRQMLAEQAIGCTSRWIDQALIDETHDEAQMDLDDVRAADALVLIKPKDSHRVTTGGHHVETGVALERGIPIVLLGDAENVFHRHRRVHVMAWPPASWAVVADEIARGVLVRLALRDGRLRPAAVAPIDPGTTAGVMPALTPQEPPR